MALIRSCAGAMVAWAVVAISPAEAQITTLRIESNIPAGHASSVAMEIFKAEVARRSQGSIEVEVRAGSPRSLKEAMDAVRVGGLFATWTSIGNFSRLVPEVAAVSLPFIFDNYDEARRAIASPVGVLITRKLEAKGFVVLGWMDLGEFHVVNSKRPLRTLDDFNGLRIRVLPNETHLATFQALGAHPVAMDFKDADAALRQGDVDGGEMDYSVAYVSRYYESQRYLSDTRHFLDLQVFAANKSAFASLNPVQKKVVLEAAAVAISQERKIVAEQEATALARMRELGAQFDPLPPKTRAALRQATAAVADDVRKWVGADIVNEVLDAVRTRAPLTVSKGSHR